MSGGGSSGGKIVTSAPIIANLRIQTSAYGRPIPVVLGTARVAGNLIDYDDFTAIAHVTQQSSGGGGSGGKGGGGSSGPVQVDITYTYTAMVLMALCYGPGVSTGTVWRDKQVADLGAFFTDLFTGSSSQTPWGYLSSNHPGKALSYRRLAFAATAAMDLGDNADIGNMSFEVKRLTVDYGLPDAAVKDVITEIITNPVYGLGQPIGFLGDYTQLHNYCGANNIWVSPAYVDNEEARETLLRLTNIANAGPFWSEDKLKIVPYGDTAITANGFTFTPDLTPQYDITDADYLDTEQPVKLVRTTPADLFNYVTGKYFNRANQYNEEPVEYKDQADIELNGLKPDPNERTYHEIALTASAQAAIDAEGRRGLYGLANVYTIKVSAIKFDLLEPMDLITLTDAALDLNRQLVRVSTIEEDGEEALTFEVEEVTVGTASPALYSSQVSGGYAGNYSVSPGSVNTPVIFDMPAVITDSGFELAIAVSGSDPNWGGAFVWVATDPGGPFRNIGKIAGPARHGVVSATFAAGADPDAVNTCSVDLTVSKGSLTGGTQADADNRNTLSWIEGELISFETALLTAAFKYDLKDYLRRGVYNTPVSAHAIGQRFVRMDQALFRYPYDPALVGKTLYVKLASFNTVGGGQQDLAAATAYSYLIKGPIGAPDAPTGFAVSQVGQVLNFRVDPITYLKLDRVEIRYADPGETDWNNGIPITNILRGNTDSNGSVPPGAWRFMARAFDLAGNPSKTWATFDLTVSANNFVVIRSVEESPHWLGTLTNFVLHYTGVLVPKSTKTPNDYAGNEWIDNFVPDPVAMATYDAPEIDKGVDAPARIWLDNVATLGPGVLMGRANPRQLLDYRLEAGVYDGYEDWAIGRPNFRRSKTRLVLDTSVGVAKISGLKTVIDNEPATEELHQQGIGSGGTAFTFTTKFHLTPLVTPLNDGALPLIPTHTGDSALGTTIHLFNTSAVEVGGVGGYKATGV